MRAEKVRNAGICNNFEGPAPLLQNVPGMGENVEFSTQIHIRQFDIGENCKRCVVPHQKNCHISDLKITNCTHPAGECRTRLWKTQWRMLNSTGKTGFAAGLLNFLHRVFNMWKKSGPSTECIALFCGKLFGPAKRQVPAGAEGAAARDNSAKPGRGAGKL